MHVLGVVGLVFFAFVLGGLFGKAIERASVRYTLAEYSKLSTDARLAVAKIAAARADFRRYLPKL